MRGKEENPSSDKKLEKCLGQACRYPLEKGIRVLSSLSEAIIFLKNNGCI